jgi:putative membrane protein
MTRIRVIHIGTAALFAIFAVEACSTTTQQGENEPGVAAPSSAGSGGDRAKTLPNNRAQRAAGALSTSDQSFIHEAAAAGIAEIQMAQLALNKSVSQTVKDFAQMMIRDHGKANGELAALAAKKNAAMPHEPSTAQQADIRKLTGLTGEAFDREYLFTQVDAHMAAVDLFRREASDGADMDLRMWAGQTLPTLEGHLSMARELHNQAKPGNVGGVRN